MSDNPEDLTKLVTAATGGGGVVAFLFSLVGWSAKRNVAQLDSKLTELSSDLKNVLNEIRRHDATMVGLLKDVSYLQAESTRNTNRTDGLAEFWKKEFSEHRKFVHDRHNEIMAHVLELVETAKPR